MTKKIKIRLDPPEPKEEEINAYKDFNRVLRRYRRAPPSRPLHVGLLRLNKFVPVIVLSVILLIVILFYDRLFSKKKAPDKTPKGKTEQKSTG